MPEFEESQSPRRRSAPQTYRPGSSRQRSRGSRAAGSQQRETSSRNRSKKRKHAPSTGAREETFLKLLTGFFRSLLAGKRKRRRSGASVPGGRGNPATGARTDSSSAKRGPNRSSRGQSRGSHRRSSHKQGPRKGGRSEDEAEYLRPAVEQPKEWNENPSEPVSSRYERPSTKNAPRKDGNPQSSRKSSGSSKQLTRPKKKGMGGQRKKSSSSSSRQSGAETREPEALPRRTPSPIVDVMSQRPLPDSSELPARYSRRSTRDGRSARKRQSSSEFSRKNSPEDPS